MEIPNSYSRSTAILKSHACQLKLWKYHVSKHNYLVLLLINLLECLVINLYSTSVLDHILIILERNI